jgi:hypothetical protein
VGTPIRTTHADGAVFRPRDIDIEGMHGLPVWLSSDVLIGIALALVVALAGFVVLSLASTGENGPRTVGTAIPSEAPGVATSAPQLSPQPALTGTDGAAAATPTFNASTGTVELVLEATERVWVRVSVDGVPVLEGILAPGTPQQWQGAQQIMLETGNAAGLQAVVNGQPQGPLGERRGEVVVLAWGPEGRLPLTPTPQP